MRNSAELDLGGPIHPKHTVGQELRLPALRVRQGAARTLYTFAVDGKLLASFATVSRIRRDDDRTIFGYQRPEVLSHIAEIRRYLESSNPMLPNAIVVAFDERVRFIPNGGPRDRKSVV